MVPQLIEVVYYNIESPLCNKNLTQAPESLGCVSAAHNEGAISGCLDLGSNTARPRRVGVTIHLAPCRVLW
jgi:hypothetical protein